MRNARVRVHRLVGVVAVTAGVGATVVAGTGSVAAETPAGCPALYVLGVQGTGQSSPDASPTTDTGALSRLMRPMLAEAGSLVQRAYIPYQASFGLPNRPVPYAESVQGAIAKLETTAKEIVARCDSTSLAFSGYSQGAHVVTEFAKKVGAGQSIPADKVAAVATFGDPTRPKGATLFPGKPGQTAPDAVPGAKGQEVTKLAAAAREAPEGGGIGPTKSIEGGYGSLAGRVASFCASGDLACDAPTDAPIVHIVANIAGQSTLNPGDPISSLATIGEAVALTAVKTAATVATEDVKGDSLDQLSYEPGASLSKRIADASDPRAPMPTGQDALQALFRVGTIGLNAITTVASKVLTPASIGQLAMVGLANPGAGLALLGTKLAGAVVELVPPATQTRLVQQAHTAIRDNITDNQELLDVTNLIKYATKATAHGSYMAVPSQPGGLSDATYAAKWFATAAKDLAVDESAPSTTPSIDLSATKSFTPTTDPSTSSTATAPSTPDDLDRRNATTKAPSTTSTTTSPEPTPTSSRPIPSGSVTAVRPTSEPSGQQPGVPGGD